MLIIENIEIKDGKLSITSAHCEEIFSGKDAEPTPIDADFRLEIDFGNGDTIVPLAIPKKLGEVFNPPVSAFFNVKADQWTRFPNNITEISVSSLHVVKNDGRTVLNDYRNLIAAANHFHMYRIMPIDAGM